MPLAAALGVVQSAVSGWLKRACVPDQYCAEIERVTLAAVTVEDLAPASPWFRVPDPDWPHRAGRPMLDFASQPQAAQAEAQEVAHG